MERDVHGRPWLLTLSFDTSGNFCSERYSFVYDNRNIEIIKGTKNNPHNIHIESSMLNDDPAFDSAFKLFSELSWLFDVRVEFLSSIAGFGKNQISQLHESYFRIGNVIDLTDYEPMTLDERQRLALSIYREGNNSTSKYYAFLCFFKIINITNHSKNDLISWLNNTCSKIKDETFWEYVAEKNIQNIGEHLYISGRCAIAHASYSQNAVIMNADKFDDHLRINKEVRFMKQIAQIYVKEELKVPTQWDVASNVMLKYFYSFFGEDLINRIINSNIVDVKEFPEMPLIGLGIYGSKYQFEYLTGIKMTVAKAGKGIVILSNEQENYPLYLEFEIDFLKKDIPYQKLVIGIRKGTKSIDRLLLIDYYNLWNALLVNGRLEIFNSEGGSLITRLWSYIPVNIDVDASIKNFEQRISELQGKEM